MKRLFFIVSIQLLMLLLPAAGLVAQEVDRGFIHPGGLHTQADFDRVKQQLQDKEPAVVKAYNALRQAAYSQSSVTSSPVETIVRGGGSGENYINAARGATMAYQNALRWKIDGTKANANTAVKILMAWANTTKNVTGNSDAVLALGLYGYQFAQAAELMRDYEGWSREDFETFRRWMLRVWYPGAVTFLRYRNGTWENSGRWWQSPGHYWSNWGLCCALCVASIGVLCDDVYIYNQGMSFFKYDQVGNYTNPPTLHAVTGHEDFTGQAIWNDALTEFLGALVVTDVESPLQTGAYGKLGQMQESGRDTGHSAMALGLAIDLAKLGWNQGDDLFAYMDHRLASGIEYVAAQTQSVEGLPWTPYQRCESGFYYTDYRSWVMQGPALGAHIRPYWGTVIGIYEGVKGVRMPFSETSYEEMGIDAGGQGATSGGYDHLGYSVLMNTRVPQLCPADQVPTELRPQMECSAALSSLIPSPAVETRLGNLSGKTVLHNELGGLVNKYNQIGGSVPNGRTLTLTPLLPEGEEDTGQWLWNTGETTRSITVTTDKSYIYRVTYTNARGIKSQLCFPIACENDGLVMPLLPTITSNGTTVEADTASILYGSTATLKVDPLMGGGTYKWSNSKATQSITTAKLKAPAQFSVTYKHTSGVTSTQDFRLGIHYCEPSIQTGSTWRQTDEYTCASGTKVTLALKVPTGVKPADIQWSTGQTGDTLVLGQLTESAFLTATFPLDGQTIEQPFAVYVRESDKSRMFEPGLYVLRHRLSGRLLTAHGASELVTFEPGDPNQPAEGQAWYVDHRTTARYNFATQPDSLLLNNVGKTVATASYPFALWGAAGTDFLAFYSGSSPMKFWDVDAEGNVVFTTLSLPTAFPFELLPVKDGDSVMPLAGSASAVVHTDYYLPDGRRTTDRQRGALILRQRRADGSWNTTKRIQ